MGLDFLDKIRRTWLKAWGPRASRRDVWFRPQLEPLEDRVVPTTRTWTGGSWLSNHWSDQFNWSNGTPQDGDSVSFPANASQRTNVQDINSGTFVGLVLQDMDIAGGDYNITGTTLTILHKLTSEAGANTIPEVFFSDSFHNDETTPITIDVQSGTLTGTDFGDDGAAVGRELIKTGSGTLAVSGIVGDSRGSGSATFDHFVIQAGELSLQSGGQTRVDLQVANGGTVRLHAGGDQISGPNRLPRTIVDAGGVIILNGHSEGLGSLTLNGGHIDTHASGTLIIEANVTVDADVNSVIEGDGTIDLGSTTRTFTVANGTSTNDLLITGRIQGSGGLTKQGAGRLVFQGSAANTYAGTTRVNAGDLALNKPDGIEAIVGQLIIGDGTGGANVDRVLLQSDEQISKNSAVRVNSSGVLSLVNHTESLGGLTLAGGNVSSFTGLGLLKLLGDVTTEAAATTATISGSLSLTNAGVTPRIFNVADGSAANDLTISAVIVDGAVTKAGPGTMLLSGSNANTYTGTTRVNEGTLALGKDSVLAVNGSLVIGDGVGGADADKVVLQNMDQIADGAAVTVNSSGLFDLNNFSERIGSLTLAGGHVTTGFTGLILNGNVTAQSASTAATISGRLKLGGVSRTFDVANSVSATDLLIDASIENGGLTKTGPGTMLLSGANTYTGTTQVNEGTLVLGKIGTTIVNGSLVIGDGVGGADADKVVLQFSDQIADSAAVTVNSSGLLDTSNLRETIGALTLVGGRVNSGTALFTPTGTITASTATTMAKISGRLDNAQRNIVVDNSVSGTDLLIDAVIENGGLTKTGAGRLELTAANTYGFTTTITEGELVVNGSINSLAQLNGGILLGKGTVKGVTDIGGGGTVRPGDGFGTLTSNGDFRLQAADRFEPQVLLAAGDPHDVLKVQGTVTLGGAILAVQPTFSQAIAPPPVLSPFDDAGSGFTVTSGFTVFTQAGNGFFNDSMHFANPGNGSETATWTFPNLPAGSYRVSHVAGINNQFRATNAPFTISNGSTLLASVTVNQNVVSKDFNRFGVDWDTLGIVQLTGSSNTLVVQLTNNANAIVFADALLLDLRQYLIIDNDGTDPIPDTFANKPEGATVSAVATTFVNGQQQQQTQQYTISYKANDGNDVSLAYITTATAAQDLLLSPASINEGQKVSLTGHLTDPDVGDFLTLTIDWGDGAAETQHPGTANFAFDHRYLDNPPGQPHGAYTVHLHWFDQHGAGNTRDLSVTVHNVAPMLFLPAEVDVHAGGLLDLPGYFTDPGVQDRWTATVDYGAGAGAQTLDFNPAKRFRLQHRYEQPGIYQVSVTITDSDGELDTLTLLVRVDAVKGRS